MFGRRIRRTLSGADVTMASARQTLMVLEALLEDLQDGISLELKIGDKILPVSIRIDPREEHER